MSARHGPLLQSMMVGGAYRLHSHTVQRTLASGTLALMVTCMGNTIASGRATVQCKGEGEPIPFTLPTLGARGLSAMRTYRSNYLKHFPAHAGSNKLKAV